MSNNCQGEDCCSLCVNLFGPQTFAALFFSDFCEAEAEVGVALKGEEVGFEEVPGLLVAVRS